jgi:hypothetical protein
MEYVWFPFVLAVLFGYVGFRQWLRHQQRAMVHRERLAAIEKGIELPPWPVDPPKDGIGLDGILLLSGLIWLALGIGGMVATYFIVSRLVIPDAPPPAVALGGIPAALVGVAHLIVYNVYRKKTR